MKIIIIKIFLFTLFFCVQCKFRAQETSQSKDIDSDCGEVTIYCFAYGNNTPKGEEDDVAKSCKSTETLLREKLCQVNVVQVEKLEDIVKVGNPKYIIIDGHGIPDENGKLDITNGIQSTESGRVEVNSEDIVKRLELANPEASIGTTLIVNTCHSGLFPTIKGKLFTVCGPETTIEFDKAANIVKTLLSGKEFKSVDELYESIPGSQKEEKYETEFYSSQNLDKDEENYKKKCESSSPMHLGEDRSFKNAKGRPYCERSISCNYKLTCSTKKGITRDLKAITRASCKSPNIRTLSLSNYISSRSSWDHKWDPVEGNHTATEKRAEISDDECQVISFELIKKVEAASCWCQTVNFSNVGHCTMRGIDQDQNSFFPFQCGSK